MAKASSSGRKTADTRKSVQLGDETTIRGEGGETHQIAGGDVPVLTTQQGIPVADDQNSLKIGRRGPAGLVLVSDGVDVALLSAVQAAFRQEGAVVKLVAPMVGGVEASDGSWIAADEKIDGGPSVLFDAVAVLLSDAGAQLLTDEATARDFVVDAFAHCKFIAHTAAARPLLEKAGIAERDKGVIELHEPGDAASFVEACRGLRLWEREAKVKRI